MSIKTVSSIAFVISASILLSASAIELKYVDFLEQLVDLDSLPLLYDGVQCSQFSSYDRASIYDPEKDEYVNWGANGDSGQYLRIDEETGEGVMAEIEGPGCIYRLWSANPEGKIRFYLDGDEKPTYEFDHKELYTGKVGPFNRPFVWQRAVVLGGTNPASNCYLPIPFAESCKVTADKPHRQYYHIGYKTFPKRWQIESFHSPLTDEEKAKLKEIGDKLEACGTDPQPDEESKLKVMTKKLPAGEEILIADLKGPGTIKQLGIKLNSKDPYAGRNIILKAYWEGSNKPSIWCPVGDFFGRASGEKPYASLPMGMTESGDYSFWRMPYRRAAKITLTNEGERDSQATCSVRYTEGEVSERAAYFHAKWRREAASATFDYPFLECTGKGKFIGDLLFIDNIAGGWWGEGDEKVYVDDEKFPSTFGTGSEDYYGDAWGIRWFVNPYHGCPQNEGRKQACYRWHISDSIPFSTSFKITIENYTYNSENDTGRNGYASVAYWYAMSGGTDFFGPCKQEDRIPSSAVIVKDAIEVEELYDKSKLPKDIRILDDLSTRNDFSRGSAVEYTGKSDSEFEIKLKTNEDGFHRLELYTPDGLVPKEYLVLHKDKPVGERVYLKKGKNIFKIRFPKKIQGTSRLVLDYAMLEQWKNYIMKWRVVGSFDNTSHDQLNTEYPPEKSIDLSQEYIGKDKNKLNWFEVSARTDGFVDLRSAMEAKGLPQEDGLAYAVVFVESPSSRTTEILAGSDDGVKIWLNGEIVHTNDVYRGATPDSDKAEIKLKKGRNELLVKVTQGNGGWGFYLRITDPKEELKYSIK